MQSRMIFVRFHTKTMIRGGEVAPRQSLQKLEMWKLDIETTVDLPARSEKMDSPEKWFHSFKLKHTHINVKEPQ